MGIARGLPFTGNDLRPFWEVQGHRCDSSAISAVPRSLGAAHPHGTQSVFIGRESKNDTKVVSDLPETRAMKRKLGTVRGRATYKKRKHLVEPVFGWIKSVIGFRQFSLRGIELVSGEMSLLTFLQRIWETMPAQTAASVDSPSTAYF